MTEEIKYQKPHRWNPKIDARCCIECEKPFVKGDLVFTDSALNIHEACLSTYGESLKKLGLR